MYRHDFSELEGLQKAEQVTYGLRREKDALCFLAKYQTCQKEVRCSLRGMEESFAERLLRYLYENAVIPEQIPDVLQDLCGISV